MYTKLKSVVGDLADKIIARTNVNNMPYIVKELNITLDDWTIQVRKISDEEIVWLAGLYDVMATKGLMVYINNDYENIKGLDKAEQDVYMVNAADGYRKATEREIKEAVRGISIKKIEFMQHEDLVRLHLLNWALTGDKREFTKAGYKLTYVNNKVKDKFYDMVEQAHDGLSDLVIWLQEDRLYEDCMDELEKAKKKKAVKYSGYEDDEIKEELPLKQVVYGYIKSYNRKKGKVTDDEKKAMGYALRYQETGKVDPERLSFVREVYARDDSDDYVDKKDNEEVKSKCLYLLDCRKRGVIKTDFVFKVIDTVSKKHYYASEKQYQVILDWYNRAVSKDTLQNSNTVQNNDSEPVARNNKVEIIKDDAFNEVGPDEILDLFGG